MSKCREFAKAITVGLAAGTLAGASLFGAFTAGQHSVHTYRSCTFDGGGTIQSGEAGTVTTGQTFVCLDGTLIKVGEYGSQVGS